MRTYACLLTLLLCLIVSLPARDAAAHEIPTDVTVQMLVEPQDDAVLVLLRVPLEAMRDVDFPLRGPGYLDLAHAGSALDHAARLWLANDLAIFANGHRLDDPGLLAVRAALPSDGSFATFDTAYDSVLRDRLAPTVDVYWAQALLDVALEFPNPAGPGAELEVEPTFARLGLSTVTRIRFEETDGETRVLAFTGNPGRVSLDPGVLEVFSRFLSMGFEHVLDGKDHLLFVLALVIPLLLIRPLIVVITAFTLAHSLTLAAAALDLVPAGLWFPPLIEVLIAATILYMALENLILPSLRRRWLEAFGFGLIHGFGFAFVLRDMLQLAGDHVLVSLAGFNAGIEVGQVLVLLLAVPLLRLASTRLPRRALAIVLSALIAHTAWHWMVDRWETFTSYRIPMPTLNAAFAADVASWLMLGLVAAFVVWLVHRPFERWAEPPIADG